MRIGGSQGGGQFCSIWAGLIHYLVHATLVCSHIGGGVYVCERCGWAHACGDACTERFVDTASGMPVCPITALCFSRMMTPWEVRAVAGLRAGCGICGVSCGCCP